MVSVDGGKQEAVFKRMEGDQEEVRLPYAMLHVTPPMSAPDFLKAGPLMNENVRTLVCFFGGGILAVL